MSRVEGRKSSGLSKYQHKKLVSGDEDAWRKIIKEYTPDLLRCAASRCWREAEDIVQATFLEAIKQIENHAIPRDFKPWLFSICRNVGAHTGERRRRRREVSLEPYMGVQEPLFREDDSWWVVSDDELLSEIERHLSKLSPQQRKCFRLRYYEGKSLSNIAKQLNTSIGNVRTQISYALSKLDKSIKGKKRIKK